MSMSAEGAFSKALDDIQTTVTETKGKVDELHKTVLGNGNIENGLVWRLKMVEKAINPDRDKNGNIIDRRRDSPEKVVKVDDDNKINMGKVKTQIAGWISIMILTGIGLLIYQWLKSI